MLTRAIFRSLCALLVGILLVSNPTEMTVLIVQIIGGLFTLSGLIAFIGYFTTKARATGFRPVFPIVGLGSMALGVLLLLLPLQFVNILMYVLGVLLCLVGIGQIVSLIGNRHFAPLTWSLFVMPLLIIATGIFILLRPIEAASTPFLILGCAYIFYGVIEFIFGFRFYRYRRLYDAELAREAAMAEAREAEATELPDDSLPTAEPSADGDGFPIDITR